MYLTPKQNEIIELIYRFRFVDRHQIQKLLKHKDARRINSWLKELTEANFLGRIYINKIPENTKPAIYYLSGAGIRYIMNKKTLELKDIKKFYNDQHASRKFIDHCISVCEFYVKLKLTEKTSKDKYTLLTKTEMYTSELLSDLKPDLYIENVIGKKIRRYFFDIFDPHVPRFALRGRVKQYIRFYDEDWYEDYSFPTILLVLPDQRKLKHLKRHTEKLEYDEEEIRFKFTTIDKLLNGKLSVDIWETAIKE